MERVQQLGNVEPLADKEMGKMGPWGNWGMAVEACMDLISWDNQAATCRCDYD